MHDGAVEHRGKIPRPVLSALNGLPSMPLGLRGVQGRAGSTPPAGLPYGSMKILLTRMKSLRKRVAGSCARVAFKVGRRAAAPLLSSMIARRARTISCLTPARPALGPRKYSNPIFMRPIRGSVCRRRPRSELGAICTLIRSRRAASSDGTHMPECVGVTSSALLSGGSSRTVSGACGNPLLPGKVASDRVPVFCQETARPFSGRASNYPRRAVVASGIKDMSRWRDLCRTKACPPGRSTEERPRKFRGRPSFPPSSAKRRNKQPPAHTEKVPAPG